MNDYQPKKFVMEVAAVKYQALMAPPVILKFPPRVADGNKTFRYLRDM